MQIHRKSCSRSDTGIAIMENVKLFANDGLFLGFQSTTWTWQGFPMHTPRVPPA
ncbi:unnamed protein product [Nesidiocoris tenuis]|uniref:Uncharacterized protein n=1 Tax=Nesidiocoris tenuis TaxID=355587 RepID=A0A6H5FZM7_9HEMI|nr:unnamed protein product [Nesidiocoris tenuis]